MKNDLWSKKKFSTREFEIFHCPLKHKPLLKQKKSTRYFIKAVTASWTEKNNCNKEPTSRLVSDPT